jgi:hypothetical protein
MEVRQIAALIIALLTFACLVGAFLYVTRELRADRRGYKRSERSRLRRSKERVTEATRP